MELVMGAFLAAALCLSATVFGFDRERVFYPTSLMVIASYYALFAIMGGSTRALILDVGAASLFLVLSVMGFKKNLWMVVGAIAAHGVFDLVHGHMIDNPGVPGFWPGFCLAYDVVAAVYLACLLKSTRLTAMAGRQGTPAAAAPTGSRRG